jgi:signal transduction histidine kinase/CheY-like chemotaxis protein
VSELCSAIVEGAGAVLVSEEALTGGGAHVLANALRAQPAWSDLSLIVLIRQSELPAATQEMIAILRDCGNLTLLERPIRIVTLISAVQSALRARRRQYEVRDLLRQQHAAVRQRDQFLAMLGHELRNPLATIVNAMGVLDAGSPAADNIEREQRAIIVRQTRHLARLVDDLLDVQRITTGKVMLQPELLDLAPLVRRALDAVDGLARAQRHEVTLDAPRNPVLVNGDPVRLEQVVSNLLTNAIKYTSPGGQIALAIETVGGSTARLTVRDNGIGIAQDLVPHVFDLFTQAERALDRSQGGLGIGLTLVRSLVEMHGGTVSVTSDGPDCGSEFRVELPLAASCSAPLEPAQTPRSAAVSEKPSAPPQRPGRRVLVVEDHDDARRSLQRLLQLWGHTVHVAEDGAAGVSLAASVRPDIALVDIGLPGLDGYEVARRIRAKLADAVRLVALTGYGQPEDEARARAAGFDVHLVKPVTAAHLARTIERCASPSSMA